MSENEKVAQELAERGQNRSRQLQNQEYRDFMGSDWGPRASKLPNPLPAASWTAARHQKIGKRFPGEWLVLPAGGLKTRNNDCDYRFRPHSAFAHISGIGTDQEPDSVLILEPIEHSKHSTCAQNSEQKTDAVTGNYSFATNDKTENNSLTTTHKALLFYRPRASRKSEEFFANSRYGELWVGARMSLAEVGAITNIETRDLDTLESYLEKIFANNNAKVRVVPGSDPKVEDKIYRLQAKQSDDQSAQKNGELLEALSELRLVKDEFEIQELQNAVDASKAGFENIIRSLPRACAHEHGERVVEGAFGAVAREQGNGLGYDTIAASGNNANTLHWICNNGKVKAGDLILVDAGVEVDSLYTADVTRTLPVNGKFTTVQKELYEAVLEAADAAFAEAGKPGVRFQDVHNAAMKVIAHKIYSWGLLPCTAEESLQPNGNYHRRWMVHGTSHHLGLDVHDCAQARREMYIEAEIEPGMCFTIEPGLYFRADDLKVPEEFRGIGIRIEDDIVIEKNGQPRRMTEDIPRTVAAIEQWMAEIIK